MLFLRKQCDQLHTHDDDHDDMGGLHRDLASTGTAIGRGEFLRCSLGAGALALFCCGGSNGANVLNQTGIVRQGIRSSFAGLSGSATDVPPVIQLTLVSASTLAAHPGVQRRLRAGARDGDREHRVRAGCSVYCGRLSGGGWGQSQRP